MTQNSEISTLSPDTFPDTFKANFEAIAPLILEEWPSMSPESLMATEGELDQVVDHVSSVTDRTRLLVRQQLRELYQLSVIAPAPPPRSRISERLTKLANGTLTDSDLNTTLTLLEERTEELLGQFKKELLPELNEKVRNNVGGSLLTALGVGFILGLLLGGNRGR
jgi:hypothetical protein